MQLCAAIHTRRAKHANLESRETGPCPARRYGPEDRKALLSYVATTI